MALAATLRVAHHGAVVQNGEIVRDDEAGVLLSDDEVSRHYLGSSAPQDDDSGVTIPVELPAVLRGPLLLPSEGRSHS